MSSDAEVRDAIVAVDSRITGLYGCEFGSPWKAVRINQTVRLRDEVKPENAQRLDDALAEVMPDNFWPTTEFFIADSESDDPRTRLMAADRLVARAHRLAAGAGHAVALERLEKVGLTDVKGFELEYDQRIEGGWRPLFATALIHGDRLYFSTAHEIHDVDNMFRSALSMGLRAYDPVALVNSSAYSPETPDEATGTNFSGENTPPSGEKSTDTT